MIDEEGGRVDRLRHLIPGLPSVRGVRRRRRAGGDVAWSGRVIGMALRYFDIEVDLAPVVDIRGDESPKGLERRTFGSDPESVVELAGAFIRGLHETGTAACLKHFPGIGLGSGDPHYGATVMDLSRDELLARDLVPFAKLGNEAGAIMIGHGIYPQIDDPDTPADAQPPPDARSPRRDRLRRPRRQRRHGDARRLRPRHLRVARRTRPYGRQRRRPLLQPHRAHPRAAALMKQARESNSAIAARVAEAHRESARRSASTSRACARTRSPAAIVRRRHRRSGPLRRQVREDAPGARGFRSGRRPPQGSAQAGRTDGAGRVDVARPVITFYEIFRLYCRP